MTTASRGSAEALSESAVRRSPVKASSKGCSEPFSPDAASGREAAWILFVAAFLIGFIQLLHPVGYGLGAGFETTAIARNIVRDGVFGNPFDIGMSGPTAVVPPLHPYFLALFYWLLPRPWSMMAITLVNVIANALTAAFMPGLSKRFCGDAWPGVVSGALWLFAMH